MSGWIELDREALDRIAAIGTEALIDQVGEKVLGNMKRLVPTDTTALHNSLGTEQVGEGVERKVYVGVDKDYTMQTPKGPRHPDDYWEAVERGIGQDAQPFIEPALAQAQVAR